MRQFLSTISLLPVLSLVITTICCSSDADRHFITSVNLQEFFNEAIEMHQHSL